MRKLAGHVDFLNSTLAHSKGSNGLQSLRTVAPERQGSILKEFSKVVVVRDPWSRLLSAYLNKFVEEPEERRRLWLRELLKPLRGKAASSAAQTASATNMSFEQFVSVLEETARVGAFGQVNEHWALQSNLCALHTLQYDFVGHFEQMSEDVMSLSASLGFDAEIPSGRDYRWEGSDNMTQLLHRYYPIRSLINRVGQLYRADLSVPLNSVFYSPIAAFAGVLPG
eukprot:1865533-Prymnesium_polylepis.1